MLNAQLKAMHTPRAPRLALFRSHTVGMCISMFKTLLVSFITTHSTFEYMRLIDTLTGEFHWIADPSSVHYAILSHVWSLDGEQTYQDLLACQNAFDSQIPSQLRSQATARKRDKIRRMVGRESPAPTSSSGDPGMSILTDPRVSDKVRRACAVAHSEGYRYIWIDSCCIDKTSSAELSEAINSMFEWYRKAGVCYAHLADVDWDDNPVASDSAFRRSKWHTRGWTLQELIAPDSLVFLSQDWEPLGTKHSLAAVVEEATGVDQHVLNEPNAVYAVSVARRMWWASRRKTTRVEDEAYALMGIFAVHIPAIYGEGRSAFTRLQREIAQRVPDQSIFAWGESLSGEHTERKAVQPLLAPAPQEFAPASAVDAIPHLRLLEHLGLPPDTPPPQFTFTSYGIQARLPVLVRPTIPVRGLAYSPDYIAFLGCEDSGGNLITLPLCRPSAPRVSNEYVVSLVRGDVSLWGRVWPVSPGALRTPELKITMADVLIRGASEHAGLDATLPLPMSEEVVLHRWSRTLLTRRGYHVEEAAYEWLSLHRHSFMLRREADVLRANDPDEYSVPRVVVVVTLPTRSWPDPSVEVRHQLADGSREVTLLPVARNFYPRSGTRTKRCMIWWTLAGIGRSCTFGCRASVLGTIRSSMGLTSEYTRHYMNHADNG
ncbi:heterokaryon incompatibility protein-domain-containing protein [Daedaleopsis nitida]|nr:heterokaryon incompatibility protein-domain-containing protein [Daedaleopsis nitida]